MSAKGTRVLGVAGLLIAGGATLAAEWTQAKSPVTKHHSYLRAAVEHLGDRVPPPPQGTAVVEADRRVFRSTRALQGSRRWNQAASDADQSTRSLLKDFSCASGLELAPESAPRLASFLADAGADGAHIAKRAKSKFRRARPYVLDPGPTCRSTRGLGDFHDYPSGHSTRGWTWGLILAELLPDRRQQLASRANAYAESRVVCGFHSPTGAKVGRPVAVLTVNSLMHSPRFRADMQQASRELVALKRHGQMPPPRQCAAERLMMNTGSGLSSLTPREAS